MIKTALVAVAATASIVGNTAATAAQPGDKEIVEAFYSQLLSGTASPGLQARMAAVLAPNWQSIGDYASPVKTRDQFLVQLQRMGSVAPDLSWKIEEILPVDGNRFVVRGRARAKPIGAFMGVAPAGRSFEIMAIDIHTVENHRIVTSYHVEDWHRAVEQLSGK